MLGGCPWKAPVPDLKKPGVYQIRNSQDGRVYVGSAARAIRGRWGVHRHHLRHQKHHNKFLQRAWNKYGEGSFCFSVLAHCSPEWCLAIEQVNILRLSATNRDAGYNLSPNAGSTLGVKHSAEIRAKNSARQVGRIMSPEWIENNRARMMERMADPVKRKKALAIFRATIHTPDVQAKATKGKREYWKNPCPEHVRKLDAHRRSEQTLHRLRTSGIGRVNSQAQRDAAARSNRERIYTPETRAKMSASAKARWAKPGAIELLRKMHANSLKSRRSKKS